ncbi:MAG TPA: SMP-30/gluconolactonase/LRE family protein [Bacteroidota bacterium]|nr:SMP-30/gluconolactonase/LRE family protein [Bacteroidota bacterium]
MRILFLITCVSFALAQSPVPPGAQLEKLATGFLQPEGPLWKDSAGLLFSDIKGNTIYLWSPVDGSTKPFLSPSDSSNGLTFDRQGCLILTQMAKRRVSRQETNGLITPLVSTYTGKRFNSPNDVVVRSDNSIFFTDPDFNIPVGQQSELHYQGIYRISPEGTLKLLDSTFDKPNGICFSPDETKLYVNDSHKCIIYVWDVVNDSTIANRKVLYSIPASGYADGMKTDAEGNVYCTGPTGVWIVSPSGTLLDRIQMSETPSNCNWGDADRKTLYITAGSSIYRIRLLMTGVSSPHIRKSGNYELRESYPNPCNPGTTINFYVPRTGRVTLCVFDVTGRRVAMLATGMLSAGEYSRRWDTTRVSSGVYFCRLSAEAYSNTKKIVVMK